MALISGRASNRSRRYGSRLAGVRSRIMNTRNRIQSYQEQIGALKTQKSNIVGKGGLVDQAKSRFQKIQDTFYDTDQGKTILAFNKAYGVGGKGKYGKEGGAIGLPNLSEAQQKHLTSIQSKKRERSEALALHEKRQKSDYSSGHYRYWMEDMFKSAGSFLTGFYKIMTGQKQMREWVDTTEYKRADALRKLNERTGELNKLLTTKTGFGDKTYADMTADIEALEKATSLKGSWTYKDKVTPGKKEKVFSHGSPETIEQWVNRTGNTFESYIDKVGSKDPTGAYLSKPQAMDKYNTWLAGEYKKASRTGGLNIIPVYKIKQGAPVITKVRDKFVETPLKKYLDAGEEMFGEGGTISKLEGQAGDIQNNIDTTKGQTDEQMRLMKQYQAEFAQATSMWAGAKRKEQMDQMTGRGRKRKEQPRVGQGYA